MLVIACGALAKELLTLKTLNNWSAMELTCIPAQIHNTPEKIPAAVEAKIVAAKAEGRQVFVAFADCGTGGQLDRVLARYQVERLPGAHCYECFAGAQVFQELMDQELGSFFLTDFLAQHFESLVWRGMGLADHPQLIPMYFGHYTRLIYLAQMPHAHLIIKAHHAAKQLGLAFELHITGLQPFGACLQPFIPPLGKG